MTNELLCFSSSNLLTLLPIIISSLALLVSYYSLMTNYEPVVVFIWDNDYQCYYIKNVGKGPAMNITISYVNESESPEWKNPVRCYSLESNGKIYIDWALKNGGTLLTKERDGNIVPTRFLGGVTRIAAVYSSANSLFKRTYTSICENNNTKRKKGNKITWWKDDEVNGIWNLKRRSEEKQ